MASRVEQINRQADLMGMTVAKKGKKYQVFAGTELIQECPTLLHVQSFFFIAASINPTAIARQAFNTKSIGSNIKSAA
jgi:hypothetical protein